MQHSTVVFAIVEAAESDAEMVFSAVEHLARQSRLEVGCARYDVYRSSKAPVLLIIHEGWESSEALQAHRGSLHVERFKAAISHSTAKIWASQCELASEA
ncbi:MAG: putative quinol monooxygenase [Paracoccaceae bacterium]